MTKDQIQANKPDGATHYYKNEFIVSYHVYCDAIKQWLVYSKHNNYWSSCGFKQRESEYKPL